MSNMKKFKIIACLALITAVICTGFVLAFADQENNFDVCDHTYTVTSFEDGVATLTCTECGDTDTEVFADHLNDTDCEELDMNSDGIVNGKDYAYLIQL